MVTPLAKLIGAAIAAGKPVEQIKGILAESLHQTLPRPERPTVLTPLPNTPTGPTVAEYYSSWIKEQIPVVRRAQARDYRRHLIRYVLPILGKVPLAELRASHVRGLQAELLEQEVRRRDGSVKKRSVKHVKNIIAGSFRAMIQQARIDELVTRDVFAGIKWPKWEPPKADPFTMDEVKRILAYFRTKRFGIHPGAGSMSVRHLPHPAFHTFVHLLLWTGLRPSEAAGLQWSDIDLPGRRLHVRRSRHCYAYAEPKTASARRTVDLFDATVELLRSLQPLHMTPEMPVFTNTNERPIEPNTFLRHWYDCLRALGLRQRGLYTCKDTFVSNALAIGARIAWLEAQTGVNYATLRRHYGQWMPSQDRRELECFAELDPTLFGPAPLKLSPTPRRRGGQFPKNPRVYYVPGMREGGLEPPRLPTRS
ncbi:MAG: integrase family protein [Deltaproteobacteria bacterium]|nr:integrase family protein [Deltaproteobacteria bacterium]